MIDEILSLGFDHVELSHGIKLSLLPGIMRAVEAGKVQVAGVHNFFPAPIDEVGDSPDSKPFTADLPQVRSKAIELTKKSIEQGAALGAGYIVLHMGTVEPLAKRTDTAHLQNLARQGWWERNCLPAPRANLYAAATAWLPFIWNGREKLSGNSFRKPDNLASSWALKVAAIMSRCRVRMK